MQDRKTSIIAIRGETKWQTWANEVRIDFELPSSHIYKPTGLIKRTKEKGSGKKVANDLERQFTREFVIKSGSSCNIPV
jgi:hypothetical protein